MRIKDDSFKVEAKQLIKVMLQDFVNKPSDTQERPCPGCRYGGPNNDSFKTTKFCSYRCPIAPKQMSSDPDRYPIEGAIVPLVYAFYTLKSLMPCWSCGGHINNLGQVIKAPKVWFYSSADFYPKLIAQYVNQLHGEHTIMNNWSVRILPYSQSMFTLTYSLEPLNQNLENMNLDSLHQDIITIAQTLRHGTHNLAHHYIQRATKK